MRWLKALLLIFPIHAQAQSASITEIEKRIGGRVGVYAFNTQTQKKIASRAAERFLMCSTFKFALCAQVLNRVDKGEEKLDRLIPFNEGDLLEWSPVLAKHVVSKSLSVEKLCAAIVQESDNGAANLLLKTVGGPHGLTKYYRELGDKTTRSDRTEPALNTPEGDKDTTTPEAMAASINQILFKQRLAPKSQETLDQWLRTISTGDKRFRAGVPAGWKVASKTGTGRDGATNEIGVLYPPKGAPIVIVALSIGSKASLPEREASLAEIAKLAVKELAN